MKPGIAGKLAITYIIIIAFIVVTGAFSLFVSNKNNKLTSDLQTTTLPSLDNLSELKNMMMDVKKLTSNLVYISNNKDHERLLHILSEDYPVLTAKIENLSKSWNDAGELRLMDSLMKKNTLVYDSITKITNLLSSPEAYINDTATDEASMLYTNISKYIDNNDHLFAALIDTKNKNLTDQQNSISYLLRLLYVFQLATIVIVSAVGLFAMRFSQRQVIAPLLRLKDVILDLSKGEVISVNEIKRADEIGQIQNAISKMINGISQKISFAEQIGMGSYDINFNLQSENDKLGTALLSMRNNLRKAHETLVEQDKQLIEAQKLARVGNYLVNLKTGTFTCSATLYDIFGLDSSFEKKFSNWEALVSDTSKNAFTEAMSDAIRDKGRFSLSYNIDRHSDGLEKWINQIGQVRLDASGNPVEIYGTVQDITEAKRLELELLESYNVSSGQNKRLLNFSYIVSHNLRMHAVNIHSLLNMYGESETEEEKAEIFELLHKASEMLDETMQHLNDVVAVQNAVDVEVTPQVLNKHVAHAIEVLGSQIRNKNATVVNNISDEVIVNYNPAYLESMVLNFISNAIKYSHPDRPPVVTLNCVRERPETQTGNWLLTIADNGIGIDMAKHGHKLFGMYKTFHGNKDAKGMGLFLTKYQIEAMGGRVEVESEVGKGSTFKIYMK